MSASACSPTANSLNCLSRVQVGKGLDLPVYFGDAGSAAVLHSIGAHKAACAVVTLDTPGANYRTVWALHKHFPQVKTYVRAHDVDHGLYLEKVGLEGEERCKPFESCACICKTEGARPDRRKSAVCRLSIISGDKTIKHARLSSPRATIGTALLWRRRMLDPHQLSGHRSGVFRSA